MESKGQVFVDERAIIVQLQWVLWSQQARSRSTPYLQISQQQFGVDSSIILKFIVLRMEACGDGPFFCSQPLTILLLWGIQLMKSIINDNLIIIILYSVAYPIDEIDNR